MGNRFLTDKSATVGRILMIFSADPYEWNFNSDVMVKKSALQHICARMHANLASRVLPILACFGPDKLRFFRGHFFPLGHRLATFRDQSAMLGEHLSQKLPLAPTYNPLFWRKMCPGGQKKGHKTSAHNVPNPNTDWNNLFFRSARAEWNTFVS